jgi:hypothetical protein
LAARSARLTPAPKKSKTVGRDSVEPKLDPSEIHNLLTDECDGHRPPLQANMNTLTTNPDGSKTFQIEPTSSPKQNVGQYWALWNQITKRKPTADAHGLRFALTRKALGRIVKPQEMTAAELAKMIHVFTSVLRDCKSSHGSTESRPTEEKMSQDEISALLS